eukprot:g44290.t1
MLATFADDTKIGRGTDSVEEAGRLQKDLNRLGQRAKKWQMEYNVGKYEVVHLGEVGQSKLGSPVVLNAAVKDFEKKFKDKTKNDWVNRESFVAHPGKYTMIEVQQGYEEAMIVKNDTVDGGTAVNKKVKPCTLDKPTQELVTLLFSHDMFKEQMQTMNLAVPLKQAPRSQLWVWATVMTIVFELEPWEWGALRRLCNSFSTSSRPCGQTSVVGVLCCPVRPCFHSFRGLGLATELDPQFRLRVQDVLSTFRPFRIPSTFSLVMATTLTSATDTVE